ncbi:MAG: luxQ 5 [Rhizobacter sp.]|nr:luxQ 5 [Rhizobacter sp.]
MQTALAQGDQAEMARLAHWLKGAGGTVGFDDFFEPSLDLEQQALANDSAAMTRSIAVLQGLASRIVTPPDQPVAAATARPTASQGAS